ncbi:Vanadium chloroperoxidase-like protein [Elsinoe fawcettii]|nr:Vanadium chloroperoxidase-like protein [Elsinoe fawcettii]
MSTGQSTNLPPSQSLPLNPNSIPVLPPTEEPTFYNENIVLFWNFAAIDLNRLSTTLGGPGAAPTAASRFLATLHIAINDAYFAVRPDASGVNTTYLQPNAQNAAFALPSTADANSPVLAISGAANTVLLALYTTASASVPRATTAALNLYLSSVVDRFRTQFGGALDTLSPSYRFGVAVGNAVLGLLSIPPGQPGFDQDSYRPDTDVNETTRYLKFNSDPTNPIRIVPVDPNNPGGPQMPMEVFNSPFYGSTANRIAVQFSVDGVPNEHIIADPPVGFGTNDQDEYQASVNETIRLGGAPLQNTTRRSPSQTAEAYFWAYDGSNLVGNPIRLYNQLLRKIAVERKPTVPLDSEECNADFARLFALANAAMGDAGIFCWQEKYNFEFWRPLSGIRGEPGPQGDPFFLTLGSPETNNNGISFKPPFPSYPSGHATFGAALFQSIRLYYRRRDNLTFGDDEPDNISFEYVSDELNGVNRDLRVPYNPNVPIQDQLGTVRTRVVSKYASLWEAIFDNAISRIFLGVHWRFDAFASKDVLNGNQPLPDGNSDFKPVEDIRYETMGTRSDRPGRFFPIGGVPLGLGIAKDIFQSNLRPTPTELQPTRR